MQVLTINTTCTTTSSGPKFDLPTSAIPARVKVLVVQTDSTRTEPDSWEPTTSAVRPDEHCIGSSDLSKLYGELLGLKSPTREEGEVPATKYAFEKAFDIVQKAAYVVMHSRCGAFPRGYASTDEQGGIRIEWWQGKTHSVHMVIAGTPGGDDYLFSRLGSEDRGRIRRPASAEGLAELIAKFKKSSEGIKG